MAQQRRNLAAFTIIVGILTLLLAASVLAEKLHEGHLPERNDRGNTGGITASGIYGGTLLLVLASLCSGRPGNRHTGSTQPHTAFLQYRCMRMAAPVIM